MSDVDNSIVAGVGLIADPAMRQFMSAERYEAEMAATAKEQLEAEEAFGAALLEAADEANFWALQHGAPPARTTADVMREHDEVTDRLDRRQARQQQELESKVINGEVIIPGVVPKPRPLPSLEAKKIAAYDSEFLAQPAPMGVVGVMVNEVSQAQAKTDKKLAAIARVLGIGKR